MIGKGYLIGAAGLALVLAGIFMYRDHSQGKRDQAHIQQANVDQGASQAAAKQGDQHAAAAQEIAPAIATDDQNVSRLQAQVARLRAAARRPPGPDPLPGMPDPEPASVPPELDLAKDALIAAQAKDITDLKAQNLQLTLADQDHRQAFVQDDAAVGELRQAIHPTYRRAAGLLYAPGQSAVGVIVEQDIARVRVVGELIQQGLPAMAGGKSQTLALVGAAITF